MVAIASKAARKSTPSASNSRPCSTGVRIEYLCDNQKLTFRHRIPVILTEQANADPENVTAYYMDMFINLIQPLILRHEAAAMDACEPLCSICNEAKSQVLMTPMSYLHKEDPHIVVVVRPSCAKLECEARIRQDIQVLMANVAGEEDGVESD